MSTKLQMFTDNVIVNLPKNLPASTTFSSESELAAHVVYAQFSQVSKLPKNNSKKNELNI